MKIKIIFISLSLFLFNQPIFAQVTDNTNNNPAPISSSNPVLNDTPVLAPKPSLLLAFKKGRDLLYEQMEAESAKKLVPKIVTNKDVSLEATLAIWDELTDNITLVRVLKNKKTVDVLSPTDYKIKLKRNNGVNSEFDIISAPTAHVVAIRHPIFVSVGTTKRPRYKLEDVVYVPYSDDLATPEVVAEGMAYLDKNIKAVYDELNNNKIKSRAYPGKLLAEVIDPTVVKSIIAIEHVSADTLIRGEADVYLRELFVILAANQNQAYAFSRSSARAFGLVQFIPNTYQQLRRIRPDLLLPADFEQGMSDPYMAIKAEVALLDHNLELLPKSIRLTYVSDPKSLGSYLAAIYNGGPSRVRKAISVCGEDWADDHVAAVNRLKQEEKEIKAEIIKINKKLKQKNLDVKTIRGLKQDKNELTAQAQEIANRYKKGTSYSLRKETIHYVAKYWLVYDKLADSSYLVKKNNEVAVVIP
ncbi:MAG: lytic transglycosylase domain-containing protein [Patescibacteria group bacterium]